MRPNPNPNPNDPNPDGTSKGAPGSPHGAVPAPPDLASFINVPLPPGMGDDSGIPARSSPEGSGLDDIMARPHTLTPTLTAG